MKQKTQIRIMFQKQGELLSDFEKRLNAFIDSCESGVCLGIPTVTSSGHVCVALNIITRSEK
jgi:hypothetical protein